MISFFIDFFLVSILIIGITAINGVFVNSVGKKLFGRNQKSKFIDQTSKTQHGWKQVGGQP